MSLDRSDPRAPAGTARRVLMMLAALADAEGAVSVRHVADRLGLAPSTAHRLLNLLVEGDFAAYDPRSATYGVGPQFYRVAARLLANVSPIAMARRLIADVARRYDETILFGLYLPAERALSFVARADGQKKLLYRVEMNVPLSLVWGASGKAALAWLPEAEIAAVLAQERPSPATGAPLPPPEALALALARVRAQGFAVSSGEKLPGALGIAAPVFGPQGLLGTLCLTMPRDRAPDADPAALGAEIARDAGALTTQLGGTTP